VIFMVNPRKLPEFKRWLSQTYKRLSESWRRPRGKHSKIALKQKSKFKMPSPGYGAPKELRYLHPSGFKEVLVYNLRDLEKVDTKKEAIKIAHTVGKKKREEILKKAEELKIKVLNP
jgi:large subunit ribosomal protein L32e